MKYKIEKLNDSSVVYMRVIGTYQSGKDFEVMKTLRHWIQASHCWEHVEKYGMLDIVLDNLLHARGNQCKYGIILRIDKIVNDQTIPKRGFTSGTYAMFKVSHTKINIEKFFSSLEDILDESCLYMRNEPIIERCIEEEGTDKVCETLIPTCEAG